MRILSITIFTAAALLLSGCAGNDSVSKFWNGVDTTVTEDNYSQAQDRFADFAELTVAVPAKQASAALDKLLDKLTSDEVSYYVYSEWLVAAYHSLLSPCRNPELFARCVERFRKDGIMNESEYAPLLELAAKDKLNAAGTELTLPLLKDASGEPATLAFSQETVFAVINLDCATCVSALSALADKPGKHVALCFGHTPAPEIPGWEYFYSDSMDEIFDLDAAPFWFTAGADGIIVTPYTRVPEYNRFATPQNQ